ncbi:DUF1598 domain-containing protein [Pirellulimonas nuda]|nr:DUF1598 domain-containing protein [Pirellulimonas nuda]
MRRPGSLIVRRLPARWIFLAAFALGAAALSADWAAAGGLIRGGAVGGILIDADGVVSTPEVGDAAQLLAAWQSGLAAVPAELAPYTDLRFVSLKGLEQQIAECREAGRPLPDAVRYCAGLLRVKYVLVYPERNDIVLAGPAEGWKVDRLGNTVGETTNRPVLFLEDLIVGLRAAEDSSATISCSIDPTREGLARVQQVNSQLTAAMGPAEAARRIEQALGPQTVSVTGIPADSHFARVIVAADFRMKRLAMNFEPAPISGLVSYLDMLPSRPNTKNMLPRWWLATDYQPLLRDADGLAWELRGPGVKCMTEEDFVNAEGDRTRSGKSSPVAQRWADKLSEQYEELADHDSAFGHLRNVMDAAVVGAVIAKGELIRRTGASLPWLMEKEELEQYPAPREVASQASFIKKGRNWIISASGGVQMFPWEIADRNEESAEVAKVRDTVAKAPSNWWWQ